MIFQRALQRELVSTAGAVFTALFTIVITVTLVKILGRAAGGKVASADVLALLGFTALNFLPTLLILTGFIAVLMVVTRSYQDSEMVVWFASGLSLTQWIGPVLRFGLPLVLLTMALSFWVTPWANQQSSLFQQRFEKREDLARVTPGKFQESSGSNRIFFVEGLSTDVTRVKNIFVNTVSEDGRTSVVVAREGEIETDAKGNKFLLMHQGRRYEGLPNHADFQMMEFERYSVLIASKMQDLTDDTSAKSLTTGALLADMKPANRGELMWRLALPLMCMLLLLLAIPLGFVNPRAGRSTGLIIALLLYSTYSSMVSVFQAAVAQNRISLLHAWWPVHLAVALLTLGLFAWRLNVNSRYHPLVLMSSLKRGWHAGKGRAQ
ncbi:MAG: export transporter permease LptF [Pseudomonadota bacterium]|jgi:lipopolysaccharide export system permease protein